ncbi:putative ABC transport system ATP-binding protein [Actinoplanes lutulentus]|uniref:Putative ABC transport system ATP-binding protein n=1 Tax=Actinoplanes lutulentus TaxID=1287878 RepID=A0A327ZPX9_9ACTN|nr:ABC transporter ATP-binding protein [Actinoplanes lutulentus]MBB2943969.1 putative ABC transport system ATP-binding protein [Actinoplanes lutulentus]RAK42798.1 putative ABC transport system ATP-binding protein [Actinoplanes lutulentus]
MTTKSTHAVELRAVTRRYGAGERAVTALDAIDATFAAGTFTAVMGPSGSGKSTLLHCAAGLDRVTAGDVLIDGTPVAGLGERALTRLRRDRVGFVFQAFNLVPALTAAQNVALPMRLAGRRPAAGEVTAALAEVGLSGRAGHRPAELSGGQQQRVAIARALVTRPAVLFADEPTGALDATSGAEVLRLLRDAVDRHGRTVVMVTHDPYAAAHADRVLFLADGRVVDALSGPADAEHIAVRTARLEAARATGAAGDATSSGGRATGDAGRSTSDNDSAVTR